MNNPKYAEVNGRRYKINTDFRYALKCNEIAKDETIGERERALALIYTLFGEEAMKYTNDYEKLLKIALKYLSRGEEIDDSEEPDMDFIKDYSYIKTSFRSDYGIKLDEEKMHWYEFMDLMDGLSNSEMGNCCILNRIRNLRNYDTKDIKDPIELEKILKAKERVSLKKKTLTQEQEESVDNFLREIGLLERK